jgi:hypothetical protein
MRSKSSIAILSAAAATVLNLVGTLHADPADKPADAQATIPVREVVLFSSGVGYFEHFGQVTGNSATVLHFKTEQVNDILKSLVLQDLDKGTVSAVTYPSQGPLERTLKSFQLDLTTNPSLSDLLNQLRGAKVSVTLAQGTKALEGTVLGVEKQQRPSGDKDHPQPIEITVVNLVGADGIVPVELSQISGVKIEDPELKKELAAALAAVAQARDKDKKPVEIHFAGQGDRRVRIGYVVETPVWKTSYRLILPGPGEAPATQPAVDEQTHDQKKDPAKAPNHQQASLQGWAIVENQTDSDWKDVQLSLVSGRPISFIEDLYQPLYIPRPVVQPELYASLMPQTYSGGIAAGKKAVSLELAEAGEQLSEAQEQAGTSRARRLSNRSFGMNAAQAAKPGFAFADKAMAAEGKDATIDATASISSIASAAKVGELFQYTVGNVSISRQQSAMLPIVTDPVQADKLSIYNQSVLASNPLLGARLKNTTTKYLLQGPITVLSGGSYAGDANIQDLPPGQERLISYGIDQEVTVHASENTQTNQLLTGRIVKGVLELTYKQVFTQDYTAEDKAETPKTLLIEAPRHQGWKLVEPTKPLETTDTLYRFEGSLKPHQPAKVTVKEELTETQKMEILPMDSNSLLTYTRTGQIPQEVKDALAKAAQLKGALSDIQRQVQEHQQKVKDISNEQSRIRENMKAVSPSSDYYKRLLTELDEQETTIQDLHKQVQTLQKQQDQQRKELEEYLSKLSVG